MLSNNICDRKSGSWTIAALSILAIALVARIIASMSDPFNLDNYALMMGVDKTFSEFARMNMGGNVFPQVLYYWLSYRVFGGSLFGYLVLPLISSLATLFLLYCGLRRQWPLTLSISFFTLLILAFNGHSLFLSQYAMVTYPVSLLVSCWLYFLFLQLSVDIVTKRDWTWIIVCIFPAAFFSNFVTIVSVATGMVSIFIFRWWQSPTRRWLRNLWQSFTNLWPLTVFPIICLAVQALYPFTNWGLEKRPIASLFFFSSQYPHNLLGAVKFLLNNGANLFAYLLGPAYGMVKPIWMGIGIIGAVVLLIAIVRLIQRRLEPKVAFTWIYLIVTFSAIAIGGLLGLYPF